MQIAAATSKRNVQAENREFVTTMAINVDKSKKNGQFHSSKKGWKKEGNNDLLPQPRNPKCVFHPSNGHFSTACRSYATLEAGKERLREQKRCFRCLNAEHNAKNCPNKNIKCKKCGQLHHYALCQANLPKNSATTVAAVTTPKKEVITLAPAVVATANSTNSNQEEEEATQVLLMTKEITVMNLTTGQKVKALAFFDTGSQISMMTNYLAEFLNLNSLSQQSMEVKRPKNRHELLKLQHRRHQ
ncbi:hypothetical protein L596_000572 [Steinernema carpocapsae]|uniref:CCHC-type domain-containing protein n=1 Tax=Steinernema carpocapsae TaxID=34508 RepID=A0A4U8UJD0_STECR|nr:hypothetical protein L596_000572 [Steinernema carpocapsae]